MSQLALSLLIIFLIIEGSSIFFNYWIYRKISNLKENRKVVSWKWTYSQYGGIGISIFALSGIIMTLITYL